jgi:hypothetical protein
MADRADSISPALSDFATLRSELAVPALAIFL